MHWVLWASPHLDPTIEDIGLWDQGRGFLAFTLIEDTGLEILMIKSAQENYV